MPKISIARMSLLASLATALGAGQMASADAPGSQPALSKEEADGLIFERQQVMLQLEKDSETLGNIASGLAPANKLAETTRSIAQSAKDSLASFQTKVPGGRSKPEVWANHAEFMQHMEAFVRNTDRMAKLGETGNVAAVSEVMVDALPCKQCHDVYREPKKRS